MQNLTATEHIDAMRPGGCVTCHATAAQVIDRVIVDDTLFIARQLDAGFFLLGQNTYLGC